MIVLAMVFMFDYVRLTKLPDVLVVMIAISEMSGKFVKHTYSNF